MKCSVIIATYTTERLKDVKKCLGSLKKQTMAPEEIILVLDPVQELIKFYSDNLREYQLKIAISEDYGLSCARNTGIKMANGEIIVFIDDDAYAEERWLETILENFNSHDVWVVGGKVVAEFEEGRPKWFPEELDWVVGCTYKGLPENKSELRNPIGANMAFRREVFEKIGFFESLVGRRGKKLLGSEETELCLRLKSKFPNRRVVYDPNAVVHHRVPKERTSFFYITRRAYYEGVSKAILSSRFNIKNEKSYLKFLCKSFQKYLIKLELGKCFAILIVIISTLSGFLIQKTVLKLKKVF